jgi:3-oxoacyl-[acyl-carrier-protein] synthase II
MRRVVVTGMGALTPIGNTIEAYAAGLKAGKNGAAPITRFDASLFKTQFACEVKDFVPEDFLDKKEARRLDLFSVFGIVAADQAIAMANFDLELLDHDRVGVIYGSGIGGLVTLENEISDFARGTGVPRYNPFLIPKMIIDIVSGHISIKHGFRGVNYATVSACATSNHAIINAFDAIRMGRADVVVTGGCEATICPTSVGGFNAMKALSERNDDFATASRPFDADRDGFVLGEGAGALVLESLEHALERGAHIIAEIAGGGMSADAYHITAPHPEGLGALLAMRMALKDANMTTADIDYVNVHGTSTPLGDVAELKALEQIFGEDAFRIQISSTKSMTGHLLGAAGAIEAIAGILAIRDGFVPPTINHFTDDPNIDPRFNLTFNHAQERNIKAVMSNAFGFGGHNTTVILKAFEADS